MGTLCVGILLYTFDRQHEYVYFLPNWLALSNPSAGHFSTIGDYLPTFLHVYAFILLTAIITAPSYTQIIPICLAWLTLDSLFEIAQLSPIAQWIATHTPQWFSGIPFLENTANYFLLGTFDARDLLSIVAGSIAAYLTVQKLRERLPNEIR